MSLLKVDDLQDLSANKYGRVVQVVSVVNGDLITGTTSILNDDTIPEITEGIEVMTAAIKPVNENNILKIEVVVYSGSASNGDIITIALFQDSITSAIAAGQTTGTPTSVAPSPVMFIYYMTAGTTAITTFSVRGGIESGTFLFNGSGTTRRMGGVMASSITVTEIRV